ncbi:hypothetical protein EBT25_01275 [bacterium]|nr:hypothetical protein [bacterium]
MATESMVGGLFGMTPEMYQTQQNQQALSRAAELGQLDPFSSARTSLIYGGNQLAGILGAQDPQLQMISATNSILRGVNMSNPSDLQTAASQLAQIGNVQGAMQLSNLAQQRAESQSTVNLREAQAEKAAQYQMATTASERNRKLISEADVALKEGKPLTATQESALRYQVAQELKPKVFRDATTGELTTIEPLNIGLAAPNVAEYLKIPQTTGTTGGVKTIQTPQSQEAQVSQAEALNELTNRTKDIKDVIGQTKGLISGWTTGYGNLLSALPLTEAKTLQNNIDTIKSNLSLSQLTALKEASKTGASGLGQVTRNEFEALQSTIAKLDPQSKDFKSDLERIDKAYTRLLNQLEGKTTRAEERAGMIPTKKPEVPGMTPADIAPKKSPFSGLNPNLQPEGQNATQQKKAIKWSDLK